MTYDKAIYTDSTISAAYGGILRLFNATLSLQKIKNKIN